mmetsp:Transcript_51172/g.91460  ORF Transcript_51172/g.91460 Transcript_51172/m.91460 type:complete len:89 (-) Transcript_51172:187-453(-)
MMRQTTSFIPSVTRTQDNVPSLKQLLGMVQLKFASWPQSYLGLLEINGLDPENKGTLVVCGIEFGTKEWVVFASCCPVLGPKPNLTHG